MKNILGFYAKNKENDLFRFHWKEDNTFYIIVGTDMILSNPNDYEILEIGFLTADSN